MHPRTVGRLPRRTPVRRPRWSRFERQDGAREGEIDEHTHPRRAFTLIELLVVIAIIAILIGLLFPAFKAVQNQARQAQAKNDLTQIVNAVNAYYTEYGRYPLGITADTTYGPGGTPTTNETLFTELRGCTAAAGSCPGAATTNPRQIVFISPPDVKNSASPQIRYQEQSTVPWQHGQYLDPWGNNYVDSRSTAVTTIKLPILTRPTLVREPEPLTIGVIAWSLGARSHWIQ